MKNEKEAYRCEAISSRQTQKIDMGSVLNNNNKEKRS